MYIFQLKNEKSIQTTTSKDIYDALLATDRLKWGFNINQVAVGHWYVKENVYYNLASEIMTWNADPNINVVLAKKIPIFRKAWLEKMVELTKPLYEEGIDKIKYLYNIVLPLCPMGHIYTGDDYTVFKPNTILRPWLYEQRVYMAENRLNVEMSSDPMSVNVAQKLPQKNVRKVSISTEDLCNFESFGYDSYDLFQIPTIYVKCYGEHSHNIGVYLDNILNTIDDRFHYYEEDYLHITMKNDDDDTCDDICRLVNSYPNIYTGQGRLLYTCPYSNDENPNDIELIRWDMANFVLNMDKFSIRIKYKLCLYIIGNRLTRIRIFDEHSMSRYDSVEIISDCMRCLQIEDYIEQKIKDKPINEAKTYIKNFKYLLISKHRNKNLGYISIISNRSYEELDMEYTVIALLIPKYITVDDVIKNCGIKSKHNKDYYDEDSDIMWRRCKLGNDYKKDIKEYINSVL